ncbi:hypothetical protein [Nostoc sp.]|uniref:hypothetical protein n=1 Tax=Nostoc sp. TaxID=1180 RepID=UPI002FF800E7
MIFFHEEIIVNKRAIAFQQTSKTMRSLLCKSECDVYDGLRLSLADNLKNNAIACWQRESALALGIIIN